MTQLKPCQFCNEEYDIVLVSAPSDKFVDHYKAQVECHHCGATGSVVIEEDLDEAQQRASDYWNEAYYRTNRLRRTKFFCK